MSITRLPGTEVLTTDSLFASAPLIFAPNADVTTTSSTYANIGGMITQNINIPVTKSYNLLMSVNIYGQTGAATAQFGIMVDGAPSVDVGILYADPGGQFITYTFMIQLVLSAGTLAINPQWKRSAGTGTIHTASTYPTRWTMFFFG